MNRLYGLCGALGLMLAGSASTADTAATPVPANPCVDQCCQCSPDAGWYGEAEFLFLRYHRAEGLRVGNTHPGELVRDNPFEFSPRLTVGYIGCSGLGARLRWWDFDMSAAAEEGLPSRIEVDTYNIDFEVFERIPLGPCWAVELSGGVRYNRFREALFDLNTGDDEIRSNSFDGLGGIVGIEAQRSLGSMGLLYGRCRAAIVMGDKRRVQIELGEEVPVVQDETLLDSTQGMLEIALGYAFERELRSGRSVFGRVGLEWQHWFNYSSNFSAGPGPTEERWVGASDVGFGGFGFSLGVRY